MNSAPRCLWRHPAMPGTPLRYLLAVLACLFAGAPTGPADAQEQVPQTLGTEGSISLEVRKGRVIRLPRPAATVFVADPEIADVQAQSASIVYLFGRRTGTTSLYAVDENDELLLRTSVTVTHNLSGLRQAVLQLLPNARITVSTIDGTIVMEGLVDSPTQAQELRELGQRYLGEKETLLYRVRVAAPTQVHLRVRVAEVSRDVVKEFGINWEALFQNSDFAFGFVTGRGVTDAANNFLRAPTADSVFGGWEGGDDFVNTALDALAEEGLVNVLAEPNLTALSGETASFLAGGEFPIPIDSDDDGVTIEFKEFGISLAFTPTVLSSDRISLRVRPEVSDLSDRGAINIDGLIIPALTTRRAETTVELASGQSFAIGGLLSTDIENRIRKFPGFGDIPVLGALFRSARFQSDETELVILVTPYLVRPVDEPRMAAPTDGLRAPTDIERILFGRLHSARLHPGREGPLGPQGQRLVGPVGFVLE
ncbi:MAG TPA: type II and III secretion system protein family protein [Geminicoccaceae bacterium]|nr:type II and III secretion system protein family protein [Geminicoccaceae bacterium]